MTSHPYLCLPAGVHLILERTDGKILLIRRFNTGFFDGLYSLPGGHIEHGETLIQTAQREAQEELNIEVSPQTLSYVGCTHRKSDTQRIDFFLKTHYWKGEPCIAEPDKCDHLIWCARAALPEKTVPYIHLALARAGQGWFFETGWPSSDAHQVE